MSAMNYKIGVARGANAVIADPQRLTSADGKRWACGRNVKRAEADHRYSVVQVWTLKQRDASGLAVTVKTGMDIEDARAWVQ